MIVLTWRDIVRMAWDKLTKPEWAENASDPTKHRRGYVQTAEGLRQETDAEFAERVKLGRCPRCGRST